MSFFSYDYYKNQRRPDAYLAYPDKRTIGVIHTYNLQTDIMANSANKTTCTIYRYEDGQETKFYKSITVGKYIHLYGVGWFRITKVSINNEGLNEQKDITALSIECELGQTYLTSFGSLGTDDDEQGGLDRYCLYNKLDAAHSILHIFLQKNPGWSIEYVDPNISTEYRSFQVDSVDSYSFLTDTVAKTYECVFIFNSYKRSVSVYKLESLGKDTGITFNYRNVIKSIQMDTSEDDVKTVLTVVGGNDDRTNTPLGIIDVNISGTNQIYNFSYYLPMMSQELRDGLARYDELCRNNEILYQEKMSSLLSHYDELNTLKTKVSDEGEDSTNWTTFGLRELQEKEKIYKTNMSLYLGDNESELYQKNAVIHAAIEAEIVVRTKQISDKEAENQALLAEIQSLVVSLPEVLGEELYAKLGPFIREDTLTDDSFIVTNSMTDKEILEMQQALLEHGRNELERVCYPQFTMEVDLINFTMDYDYKRFTDALEMFNIIHISFEDHDSVVSARLLKVHINWDNPSDFKVTFSNKNRLDEFMDLLKEVQDQADNLSSQVGFATGAWKNAATVSVDVNKYMNNILNASKQQLVSNDNNEVKIDSTGILCRRWHEEQQIYDPCQVWITANQIAITHTNWNDVGLALGYIKMGNDYFFGLAAREIVGQLLMSEKLIVSNTSGSYTIDKNGFVAKQGAYQVKINPDTPNDIFSISIDGNRLLYVDTKARALTFEGKLITKSGQLANFNIADNTLISGNIGLCSDKTSGAIAYWAGNADRTKAPFRVSNTGALICSNATITGGSLKIGANFEVNAEGILTAKSAVFTGNINASIITGSQISGTIITGGAISVGALEADADTLYLGRWMITTADRGWIGTSNNNYWNASASGSKQAWCSFGGALVVNGDGETHAQTIITNKINGDATLIGSNWWNGYTLFSALDYLYEKIESFSEI